MKFQRSTFLLVLVATLLMGGFFVSEVILEPRREKQREQQAGGALFDFEESDIAAFVVQRPDLTLAFEKRAEPPEGESTWLMKQPEEIQASDGAVAFLLNLIATETSQRTLEVADDRKTEFGFDRPAIVNVILENGEEHVLVLGLANFDQSAFYALIDTPPTADPLPIQLVTVDFEPAINRPLDEWKYTAEQPEPSSDADGNDADGSDTENQASDINESGLADDTRDDSGGEGSAEQGEAAPTAEPESSQPSPAESETTDSAGSDSTESSTPAPLP